MSFSSNLKKLTCMILSSNKKVTNQKKSQTNPHFARNLMLAKNHFIFSRSSPFCFLFFLLNNVSKQFLSCPLPSNFPTTTNRNQKHYGIIFLTISRQWFLTFPDNDSIIWVSNLLLLIILSQTNRYLFHQFAVIESWMNMPNIRADFHARPRKFSLNPPYIKSASIKLHNALNGRSFFVFLFLFDIEAVNWSFFLGGNS